MPSIRMVASRVGYEATPPKDREELSRWCREMVARLIGDTPTSVPVSYIEVLWPVFEEGQNDCDLTVEIVFSVGVSGFNPPQERVNEMVERLSAWLAQTPLVAAFKSVAVWARPQHDAVFRIV